MRGGCAGGSDGESEVGVGETTTAPLGVGLGSSVVLPKRGASAAGGGAERAELVELGCRWRELRRLSSRLRATCPPMWRCRGDAALWLALSESALLGERTGETRGAGLVERWPGAGLAERGTGLADRRWPGAGLAGRGAGLAERWPGVPVGWACGCAPPLSASGRGLLWRALASLYRGDACAGALAAIRCSGLSGGLVSCTGAAVSGAVRSAAAAACGGVRGRGRHWLAWASQLSAGPPVRPRLGVVARWKRSQARVVPGAGDGSRQGAWRGAPPELGYPGTAGHRALWAECPRLEAGAPIGAGLAPMGVRFWMSCPVLMCTGERGRGALGSRRRCPRGCRNGGVMGTGGLCCPLAKWPWAWSG